MHARRAVVLAAALLVVLPASAGAAITPAPPSSVFTDSVGVNLNLGSYTAVTPAQIGSDLSDLTGYRGAGDRVTANVRGSLETNDRTRLQQLLAAIPNLRLAQLTGRENQKMYRPENAKMLPVNSLNQKQTGGWNTMKNALDNANFIAGQADQTDQVVALEGVNEANARHAASLSNGTLKCANGWLERAADQQLAIRQYVNGVAPGEQNAWNLISPFALPAGLNLRGKVKFLSWSNGRGCIENPSTRLPFEEAQKDFTVDYAGFPSWNAGGTAFTGTLGQLVPGAGSVQAGVDIANVHTYPLAQQPEWLATGQVRTDVQNNLPATDCTRRIDNDPATTAVNSLTADAGLLSCGALQAGIASLTPLVKKPVWMTETGYFRSSSDNRPGAVTDAVAATYLPRLLLNNRRYGIERTFLFQLYQEAGDLNLALINNGVKTLPFYAVKNTLALLRESTPAPTAASLDITCANGTSYCSDTDVRFSAYRTGAKTYALAIWPVDSVTDGANPANRVAPPAKRVMVTVGGGPYAMTFQSPTPVSTTANGPRTITPVNSTPDSFTLDLSGDAVIVTLTAP